MRLKRKSPHGAGELKMYRMTLTLGLAAALPLASLAMERTNIDEELNGLDVETEIVGSISEAGSATAGVQMLQVRNNEEVPITCEIDPAASEMDGASVATIQPGESATLQLGSDYASAATRARLDCQTAE
jgi:hypothetical protein